MSRIWMSGLEAAHIDVFNGDVIAAISDVEVRTGTYSLRFTDKRDIARASFPASISELFCRFAVRPTVASQHTNGNGLMTLFDSLGAEQITIQWQQSSGLVQVRRGDYGGAIIAVGGHLHKDRWQCLEFRLVVDNVTGVFQLKINGELVIDYGGDTQASGNANVAAFGIGRGDGASLNDLCTQGYYDDIAFNDTADGVNDGWIGRGGIQGLFPTGAGASTDLGLVPDGGEANWEDVDEVPPDDDTSYVFDTLIDDHDSYVASNLVATGTIAAVQWLARARSDFAGAPEIARILRIGGSDYQGSDVGIDVAYDYVLEMLDENPDAGPGTWTKAAIDGMEIGVKVR